MDFRAFYWCHIFSLLMAMTAGSMPLVALFLYLNNLVVIAHIFAN
jgi:hypothetical protein